MTENSTQLQVLDPVAGIVTPMSSTFPSIDRMESAALSADGTKLFVQTPNNLEVFDPVSGALLDRLSNAYGYRHVPSLTP